jgi:hypothetical protein
MEINFCISSNRDFYEKTLPVLLPSLLGQGFSPDNIWVFVGDETAEFGPLETKYNVRSYRVPIRAFEFTGPLAILDYFADPDRYWFLLHDTCHVGPRFRELLEAQEHTGEHLSLGYRDGVNNMGVCMTSYIAQKRAQLDAYRSYALDRLQDLKRKIIAEEGTFFGSNTRGLCSGSQLMHNAPDSLVYGTEGRKVEYWVGLDLYKIKSNYYIKESYNLEL